MTGGGKRAEAEGPWKLRHAQGETLDLDGRNSVQGGQELKYSERKANLGRDDVIKRGAGE